MKASMCFAAALAALFVGCDARVNTAPPAENTTIVNPPAEKKVESNTTIVNPPATEKKIESTTTTTNQ